ncbi:MAG TPA: leucine-rich repeat domain-containing protein [Bacteroidales bacterium]|nr:leucine-rich repeat domain-containing protein [Bacteroidales bacterium]
MAVIRTLFLLFTGIALGFNALGQVPRPEPPFPLCHDLGCLKTQDGTRSLDLRKGYRHEDHPDPALLKGIVWLDLSANRLKNVPEWVCDCQELEYLNLERNQLFSLPDCIGNLKKLKYISVNRNPLASLPAGMANCDSLRYLDLWQTWIDYLPPEWRALNHRLVLVDLRDIRMTMEQQMEIRKVLPDPEIRMSAWCNCIPHRNKEQ